MAFFEKVIGLVVYPQDDGSYVVLHPDSLNVVRLSPYAKRVLDICVTPQSVESIAKHFPEISDVHHDVLNCVERLCAAGLVAGDSTRRCSDSARQLVYEQSTGLPEKVTIIPTLRCNLRCIYCYNKAYIEPPLEEIDAEAWKTIVTQLLETEIKKITITGGEPFLRPELFSIFARLKANGAFVLLCTNGIAMDSLPMDAINSVASLVNISIDSSVAAEHDRNRGKGSHAAAVSAAKRLSASGIPWQGQMVFGLDGRETFEKTKAFVLDLGANRFSASLLSCSDHADELSTLLQPVSNDINLDCESILSKIKPWTVCSAARTEFAVGPDGAMYPCHMFISKEFRGLNLATSPLKTAWTESEGLQRIRQFDFMTIDTCGKCQLLPFCSGGCRGMAFQLTGRLDGYQGVLHCRYKKWVLQRYFSSILKE